MGASKPIYPPTDPKLHVRPAPHLAARAVAGREVAALAHEVGDDAVEGGALEVEGLAGAAHALLARAQRAEVLVCVVILCVRVYELG